MSKQEVVDIGNERIRRWLREKPRTEDELIEMFTKCIEAGYEGAISHHKLDMQKMMLKEIFRPVEIPKPGPWWKFWAW